MPKKTVTITDNNTGKSIEVDILQGSQGPPVIDIGTVYKELGMFTFDPGFVNTAACESAITFIDGEKGVLQYRGYPSVAPIFRHKKIVNYLKCFIHRLHSLKTKIINKGSIKRVSSIRDVPPEKTL